MLRYVNSPTMYLSPYNTLSDVTLLNSAARQKIIKITNNVNTPTLDPQITK